MYFAYDTDAALEPLAEAGKLLRAGGITMESHKAMCYVLAGYPGDTTRRAEKRFRDAWGRAGMMPYPML